MNRDRWIQSPECWPLHHEADALVWMPEQDGRLYFRPVENAWDARACPIVALFSSFSLASLPSPFFSAPPSFPLLSSLRPPSLLFRPSLARALSETRAIGLPPTQRVWRRYATRTTIFLAPLLVARSLPLLHPSLPADCACSRLLGGRPSRSCKEMRDCGVGDGFRTVIRLFREVANSQSPRGWTLRLTLQSKPCPLRGLPPFQPRGHQLRTPRALHTLSGTALPANIRCWASSGLGGGPIRGFVPYPLGHPTSRENAEAHTLVTTNTRTKTPRFRIALTHERVNKLTIVCTQLPTTALNLPG